MMSLGNLMIQVDAFTAEPFRGNPAAVCLLDREASERWMQAVAAEMNLSETAFLVNRGGNDFTIRWFTPLVEVPLCGHATLASAHVLWEDQLASPKEPIRFHPRAGVLTASREAEWIRLDFPAIPMGPCVPPPGLAEALGGRPLRVSRDHFPTYLAELDSEETVRCLRPHFAQLGNLDMEACIVTARGESRQAGFTTACGEPLVCDFVSRFFAPRLGINEDPVTGVAHCSLGPYWAERLGKTELVGHQVSMRGGVVRVRVHGERVHLLGQARTVLRGHLLC